MNNGETHLKTIYPETEGTIYKGTVNSGYYMDPDGHICAILSAEQLLTEKAELFILTANTSRIVTNILHGIGI